MNEFSIVMIGTHIPYMLLCAAILLELWWMRRKLRGIARRLEGSEHHG